MSNKNAVENQSSITLCQPSCGYYFSSGLVVSETIYSSAEHGAIYNAASRIIIDGGRKALQTAALGGMLAQNFTVPVYAGNSSGVIVSAGRTVTVSAGETWTGTYVPLYTQSMSTAILNVYGKTSRTFISSYGIEYILNGGVAHSTVVHSGGYQIVSSGGIAKRTTVGSGGVWHVLSYEPAQALGAQRALVLITYGVAFFGFFNQ